MQPTSATLNSGILQQGTATLLLEENLPIVEADVTFNRLIQDDFIEGNIASPSMVLLMHPDDRLHTLETLQQQLLKGDEVALLFRNNSPLTRQKQFSLRGHVILLDHERRALWCILQEVFPFSDNTNIIQYINLLVAKIRLDEQYSIEYANPAFYQFMNISPSRPSNTLPFNRLSTQDQPTFLHCLHQCKIDGDIEKEFQLTGPDGMNHWFHCHFTWMNIREKDLLLLTLRDITLLKETQRKLEEEQTRLHTLAALSHDVLFEYNLRSDELAYYSVHHNNYQERVIVPRFFGRIESFFHPEDIDDVNRAVGEMLRGADHTTFSARVKEQTLGIYLWRTVYLSYVKTNNIAVKIIGKTVDFQKEKECELHLREELQYDVLTHLYNKVVCRKRIEETLASSSNELHALLVIDIDNFKKANDCHGHLFGDKVLIEISDLFHRLFQEHHIVGRIGGDEFLVLMTSIQQEREVIKMIENLHKGMRTISQKKCQGYPISLSIGYSLYPQGGTTFETLFQAADTHLYQEKKKKDIH